MVIMRSIRVVLGDDHLVVRAGIRTLLESASLDVVGEAENGRDVLRLARQFQPDVAVVDISMPLLNGLETTRRIGRISDEIRVVILSMFDDPEYRARAARAGAWGYVIKDEAPERLIEVIRQVASGERLLEPGPPTSVECLSEREREVLQLIIEGKKSGEIAQIMNRSVHTVRNHRARLMRKLGARTGSELIEAAEALGMTQISPLRGGTR